MHPLFSIPIAVAAAVVAVAAATDMWKFRIPNLLTVPALVAGPVYHAAAGTPGAVESSLLGLGLGFGILFVLFAGGMMGAGDVKLMAAVGAWLGANGLLRVLMVSVLVMGLSSLVMQVCQEGIRKTSVRFAQQLVHLVTRGIRPATAVPIEAAVKNVDRRKRLIPFAAMVAIGMMALGVFSCL
jgi:prepilin peptidase CpaA